MCRNLSAASAARPLDTTKTSFHGGESSAASAVESTPPGTASAAFGRAVNVPCRVAPTVALDTMPGTSDALPGSEGSLAPQSHDSRQTRRGSALPTASSPCTKE
ncbi:hypothetical protein GWK47_016588 [Chionoecetes opilio]|uniref:Uncharacterized protein n=1 Tax=Chionoecetes opilio TaxID=41210 RepID=A0A8J4XSB6_CHIOP|nr:hypothetical protein GWK47_016588 [Chionoecetes opilio]